MKSIVFFGSSSFSTIVLEKLVASNQLTVTSVVTKEDKKAGRGQKLAPNPVKVLAEKHNLNIQYSVSNIQYQPGSIGLVAAYGKIIPQSVLDTFSGQIYNIHPSLLPKYRGPSPLQQQILDAVTVTGVTIIKLDAEMDHGPIVAQETDTILPNDTWITLGERLFARGTDLFLSKIQDLKSNISPQDHGQATYTKKITRQDGFIPWVEFKSTLDANSYLLDARLRAFAQWPGVWTTMPDGKRLKLISFKPEILVQIEGKSPQPWPIVI